MALSSSIHLTKPYITTTTTTLAPCPNLLSWDNSIYFIRPWYWWGNIWKTCKQRDWHALSTQKMLHIINNLSSIPTVSFEVFMNYSGLASVSDRKKRTGFFYRAGQVNKEFQLHKAARVRCWSLKAEPEPQDSKTNLQQYWVAQMLGFLQLWLVPQTPCVPI